MDPRECAHVTVLAEGEEGAYRARCLICAAVGPERETSEEATAEALRERGGGQGR